MPVGRKFRENNNPLDRVSIAHSKEGRLPHGHQHKIKRKDPQGKRGTGVPAESHMIQRRSPLTLRTSWKPDMALTKQATA